MGGADFLQSSIDGTVTLARNAFAAAGYRTGILGEGARAYDQEFSQLVRTVTSWNGLKSAGRRWVESVVADHRGANELMASGDAMGLMLGTRIRTRQTLEVASVATGGYGAARAGISLTGSAMRLTHATAGMAGKGYRAVADAWAKRSHAADGGVANNTLRALGGLPEGLNPVPAHKLELWQGYLSKRGVRFEIGTERAYAKLAQHDAVGLFEKSFDWELNQAQRTIYLPKNPNASVFYEEGLHALDSLKGRPRTMELGGKTIDAWEYRAKSTLIDTAPKRLTYDEFQVLERQLEMVKQGRY